MQMSQHAMIRMKQRGITQAEVDCIIQHGTPVQKKGNALEYSITKKLRSTIEKAKNKAVLLNIDTGEIKTVYHKTGTDRR